ncbi:NAD(P)-binding domain-containing protein [Nocardia sp. NBC_00881]|uniref:NADPH-dependent F420 reductase n=1 Tax=Nocardia sp. NBC_00881 TaxID=2975995 RepID=UPI00387014D4|nr:NAD(P)-binding domain-containing protein [Nocardia sp. NBC_00881]
MCRGAPAGAPRLPTFDSMRISIFGAGNMAEALGAKWTAHGHDLMITGRSPEKAAALAERLNARAGSFAEAAQHAEAALIAVLYHGMDYTLDRIGDGLNDKPILDCNNPVEIEEFTLTTPPGKSMAQHIAKTTGGHVVKAFNLCHADVWRMPTMTFDGRPLSVPFCGDNPTALWVATRLIADVGGVPLPTGDLRHAQYLEATAAIIIAQLFGGRPARTVFNLVDDQIPAKSLLQQAVEYEPGNPRRGNETGHADLSA